MRTTAPHPATTPIPVQLSEPEFIAFILPHLSMPKRRPKWKPGYYRVFNLILRVLYTGMQWKCLPCRQTPRANLPSTTRPSTKSSRSGRMMGRSGRRLWRVCGIWRPRKQLDTSVLHGDGTNTVAKKGAMGLATRATNTRKARR